MPVDFRVILRECVNTHIPTCKQLQTISWEINSILLDGCYWKKCENRRYIQIAGFMGCTCCVRVKRNNRSLKVTPAVPPLHFQSLRCSSQFSAAVCKILGSSASEISIYFWDLASLLWSTLFSLLSSWALFKVAWLKFLVDPQLTAFKCHRKIPILGFRL